MFFLRSRNIFQFYCGQNQQNIGKWEKIKISLNNLEEKTHNKILKIKLNNTEKKHKKTKQEIEQQHKIKVAEKQLLKMKNPIGYYIKFLGGPFFQKKKIDVNNDSTFHKTQKQILNWFNNLGLDHEHNPFVNNLAELASLNFKNLSKEQNIIYIFFYLFVLTTGGIISGWIFYLFLHYFLWNAILLFGKYLNLICTYGSTFISITPKTAMITTFSLISIQILRYCFLYHGAIFKHFKSEGLKKLKQNSDSLHKIYLFGFGIVGIFTSSLSGGFYQRTEEDSDFHYMHPHMNDEEKAALSNSDNAEMLTEYPEE